MTSSPALTFTITNNADFEIVNRNQLKTKRRITAIGDMTTINVFPTLKSKTLLAVLLSLRTAWAAILTAAALEEAPTPNLVGQKM
jgi:hypothetical protein